MRKTYRLRGVIDPVSTGCAEILVSGRLATNRKDDILFATLMGHAPPWSSRHPWNRLIDSFRWGF